MEKEKDRPKLSESSDTDEAGEDANEGNATTFNTDRQSCGVETLRKQLESVCLNKNSEANDVGRCNHELEDRGIGQAERSHANTLRLPFPPSEPPQVNSRDEIDLRLPSPPSSSPAPKADDNHELAERRYEPYERPQINNPNAPPADDSKDCVPVSTDNVDSIPSSLSERDSYTWNLVSSNLPSLLTMNDGEERLIWPIEEEFSVHNGRFEEDIDYTLDIEIGEGAFGKCYLAATTQVSDSADDPDQERVFCVKKCQYRQNELLALHLARKENVMEIIMFYGAKVRGSGETCIFMEFMAGGSIEDVCQEKGAANNVMPWPVIPEENSFGYVEDVLKALKFLHSKGIVHRDIKGANVLLAAFTSSAVYFFHAKLADFGSAESNRKASQSDDMWKTGCLLIEMLNGARSPLFGIGEGGFQRQNSCKPEDHIPSEAMQETKDLLRLFFGVGTREENDIPSAAEVLEKSNVFPVEEFLKKKKN